MYVRELPVRMVIEIAKMFLEEDSFEDLYDYSDYSLSILRELSAWASADVEILDVEFIHAFIKLNNDLLTNLNNEKISSSILSKFKVPELKLYQIEYDIIGPATLTERWSVNIESYDKDFVESSARNQWYSNNLFEKSSNQYVSHSTENFEPTDFEVVDINLQEEQKKSLLSRLVVENTTEVLENLDKETLFELRNLINQKISSF